MVTIIDKIHKYSTIDINKIIQFICAFNYYFSASLWERR